MTFYEQAIQKIEPQYRTDFTHYIWTGDGRKEFLDYLANDKNAQEAAELVFCKQAEGLEKIAKYLAKKKTDNPSTQVV